ncbi:glutaredoxin family protein [Micrococcus luteus]
MDDQTPTTAPASASCPRVQLLVREGCHLCTAAVETVAEVCGRVGEPYGLLDGAEHPELLERHAEEIPVLFVDGVQRDFWRVDPVRLERMLTSA